MAFPFPFLPFPSPRPAPLSPAKARGCAARRDKYSFPQIPFPRLFPLPRGLRERRTSRAKVLKSFHRSVVFLKLIHPVPLVGRSSRDRDGDPLDPMLCVLVRGPSSRHRRRASFLSSNSQLRNWDQSGAMMPLPGNSFFTLTFSLPNSFSNKLVNVDSLKSKHLNVLAGASAPASTCESSRHTSGVELQYQASFLLALFLQPY